MAWLWNSWEEFVNSIHPVTIRPGLVSMSLRASSFENDSALWESAHMLEERIEDLRKLGFESGRSALPHKDDTAIKKAHQLVHEAVHAGEGMLVYHKRLAQSDASYGFLHQHDMIEHWARYAQTGRISLEIAQFIIDARELLDGYYELAQDDDQLLVRDLDLPEKLKADFYLARNLFSVGFEEVGLLIAGRGLEGVLRAIAHARGISLQIKGKAIPASEVDLYELIETMFQLRCEVKKTRLVSPETRSLLHYLRALRNSGAHPSQDGHRNQTHREQAKIMAEAANELWKAISTRAKFKSTTIVRI